MLDVEIAGKLRLLLDVDEAHAAEIEGAARGRGAWTKTVTLSDAQAIAPSR